MIRGNVDVRTPTRVEGWCYDTRNTGSRLGVSIMYAGQEIAYTIARKFRHDMHFIHPDADYAFFVNIPEVENPALITVLAHGFEEEEILPCSPASVQIPEKFSTPSVKAVGKPEPESQVFLWNSVWEEEQIDWDAQAFFDKVGGNTGNLAFTGALMRHTNARRGPAWHKPIFEPGVAVLPCANQLGAHCDMSVCPQKILDSACSVTAIGLGAQAGIGGEIPKLQPSTIQWVENIIARAPNPDYPNISLRGNFSLKVMEHYGWARHAIVLGCPSFFYNPDPDLGKKIAKNLRQPRRVCVLAAQPGWGNMREVEPWLARLVSLTDGAYVIQDPLSMMRLAMGQADKLSAGEFEAFRAWALPDLDRSEVMVWLRRHAKVFANLEDWLDFYRDFDFVIGARIHGIILALLAGVPALCITHDARTKELCETMQIPHLVPARLSKGVRREDLLSIFRFNPDDFDANRHLLQTAYREFLEQNRIKPNADYF